MAIFDHPFEIAAHLDDYHVIQRISGYPLSNVWPREAEPFPVLKIKVGLDMDEPTIVAVRP